MKKHSALQEYLILFLKHYGLAKNSYKWIGFVPRQSSKETLERGDFFTEGRYGEGLFHNKITHMLQQVLILCAIEDKVIQLKYQTSEGEQSLTIEDLLVGTMNEKEDGAKRSIWPLLRDAQRQDCINFSDPHRLGSFIMYEGSKMGLHALSAALIDSYCKSLRKLVHAYRESGSFPELSVQNFVDKMDDMQTRFFTQNKYLFHYALKKETEKKTVVLATNNENYAIVEKRYHPNSDFKVKTYEPEDSQAQEQAQAPRF